MILSRKEWVELGNGEMLNKLIIVAVLSVDDLNLAQRLEFVSQVFEIQRAGYRTVLITTTNRMYFSKLAIEAITERLFLE